MSCDELTEALRMIEVGDIVARLVHVCAQGILHCLSIGEHLHLCAPCMMHSLLLPIFNNQNILESLIFFFIALLAESTTGVAIPNFSFRGSFLSWRCHTLLGASSLAGYAACKALRAEQDGMDRLPHCERS